MVLPGSISSTRCEQRRGFLGVGGLDRAGPVDALRQLQQGLDRRGIRRRGIPERLEHLLDLRAAHPRSRRGLRTRRAHGRCPCGRRGGSLDGTDCQQRHAEDHRTDDAGDDRHERPPGGGPQRGELESAPFAEAARFLRGLIDAVDDPAAITAVVNVGDDCELHGLSISPDLDTITYTLAGAIDPDRGWGLIDETWRAMAALARYEEVKPDDSSAAPRWFGLGDQDLATHFYRTARLREGASLTTVTDEVRRAWDVTISVVPASDDAWSTIIDTREHGEISFQDYFVRLRHDVEVSRVRFEGTARLGGAARTALTDADTVVIAPSNPLVSIGPIIALPDVRSILSARRERVVAVSPIVGGVALKGPADRMMRELGHDPSVVGVASLYAPFASVLLIDPVDAEHTAAIEAAGVHAVVTASVMSTPTIARSLAEAALGAIRAG